MKRLFLPLLLVLASLLVAAIFTTITAVTFASYTNDNKDANNVVINKSLIDGSNVSVALTK
jgi:hypothetical protein